MAMAAACHYVCVAFRMLLEDFWTVAKGLEDLEIKGDPFSASVGCLIVITTPLFFFYY